MGLLPRRRPLLQPPRLHHRPTRDMSLMTRPFNSPSSQTLPNLPPSPPDLLSSLSFDPQQLLAQLSTDLSTPAAAEPKKRNRIPGLTAQQRAALKRQKHREIDTQRRHREQAAIGKLHSLVYQPLGKETRSGGNGRKRARGEWLDGSSNGGDEVEQNDDEDDSDNEDEDNDSAKSKDKVTILEHSARRLEQMQSIILQLTAACTTQQNNNRTLLAQVHSNPSSHALSLFHQPVAQQLDANLGQQSLYASMFLSASASMFVIRCDTGVVMDVNDRLLEESGWLRHHIVGRLMTAPYDALVCEPEGGCRPHHAQRWASSAGGRQPRPTSTGRQAEPVCTQPYTRPPAVHGPAESDRCSLACTDAQWQSVRSDVQVVDQWLPRGGGWWRSNGQAAEHCCVCV